MLDLKRFGDLEKLDTDGTFLKELIEDYNSDCIRNFTHLKACFSSHDLQGFREACHALKSVAGSVAAAPFCERSGKYMLASDNEILEHGQQMIEELEQLNMLTSIALNNKTKS